MRNSGPIPDTLREGAVEASSPAEVTVLLARVRLRTEDEVAALEAAERAQAEAQLRQMQFQHASAGGYGADEEGADVVSPGGDFTDGPQALPKIGRNDPCPCGSGKKYKHCHGQLS